MLDPVQPLEYETGLFQSHHVIENHLYSVNFFIGFSFRGTYFAGFPSHLTALGFDEQLCPAPGTLGPFENRGRVVELPPDLGPFAGCYSLRTQFLISGFTCIR